MLAVVIRIAILLAIAAPVVAIASWQTRTPRWRPLVAVAAVVALDELVLHLPRVDLDLEWNWQGKLLGVAWVLGLLAVWRRLTPREVGLGAPRAGWLRPSLVVLAVSCLPAIGALIAGARQSYTAEGWWFEATMPGLAEELVVRGVMMALLDRAFGRPWRLAGAEVGWSLPITAVLFAAVHVVQVDREAGVELVWIAGSYTLLAGLTWGWLRARVGSVWPGVVIHNASNLLHATLSLVL